MGGTVEYVYHQGQRLTAWMLYVILMLDADLFRAFGVHVLVSSAIRTYEEQKRIFLARYVRASDVNGRRVYDTRVWNGVRWYRISSGGTVAVPGYSNHEIQGTKAAVDIRDSGRDAGITNRNSVRGRWIRDWCRRTGLLIASGDGFGEGWHFDVPGIFRKPPAIPVAAPQTNDTDTPASPEEEDDEMKNVGLWYTRGSDKAKVVLIVNFGSGIYHEYSNGKELKGDYNNPLAAAFGTGSYAEITESHARVIKAACDKAENLTVAIVD